MEKPQVVRLGTVTSTQDIARDLPIGSVVVADHQTAGGYPVVAGVARADLPLLAQLLPGDHLRFREVTVEAAQADWRRLRAALESLRN